MLAVRVDPGLDARLRALARAQGRSRSEVVREALTRYLEADGYADEFARQARSLHEGGPEAARGGDVDDLLEAAYEPVDAAEADYEWTSE